jgi:accessory gene regulator B
MRKWFLDSAIKNIKKNYPQYSDTKIEEIKYGLESIYILVTKMIIIFSISYFLGILKEVIILTALFVGIRNVAFGIHASNSITCLIISSIVFMGAPYLAREITLSPHTMLVVASICVVLYIIYAPADTKKRPLVNKRKRLIFKTMTIIIGIIYIFGLVFIANDYLKNLILFSLIIELLMILPITYKLFGQSYNNYKNFKLTSLQ